MWKRLLLVAAGLSLALPLAVSEAAAQDGGDGGTSGVADLSTQQAHWVTEDTIAWNVGSDVGEVRLHSDPAGNLEVQGGNVTGGSSIRLERDPNGFDSQTREKFPHLADYSAFRIPEGELERVPRF